MSPRTTNRETIGLVVLMTVLGAALLSFSLFQHYWFEMRNPSVACIEGFGLSEPVAATLDAAATIWPLGIRCSYVHAGQTVTVDSGWGLTIAALLGLALILAGVLVRRRARRHIFR